MASIDLVGAQVDFPIFDARSRSLKKTLLGPVGGAVRTRSRVPVVEALQEITLTLRDGDRVGLVGPNGAGKSTLLPLLTGIYELTRGTARIEGRVAPVVDLAVGMDPEISGYENILIRGLFLGMSRRQMQRQVDEIAASRARRLPPDAAAHLLHRHARTTRARGRTATDPEILILDEGIAAVDAAFLAKARDQLLDLVHRASIVVFASHSGELLAELCDTAIWLDRGKVHERGTIHDVLFHYSADRAVPATSRVGG